MFDDDILIRTTIRVIEASSGSKISTWPHAIAKKLGLMDKCLVEIAVIRVIPPNVITEGEGGSS